VILTVISFMPVSYHAGSGITVNLAEVHTVGEGII